MTWTPWDRGTTEAMAGEASSGGAADRSGSDEAGRADDPWRKVETEHADRDRIARAYEATHDPGETFEKQHQDLPAMDRNPGKYSADDFSPEQRAELEEMTGQKLEDVLANRDQAFAQKQTESAAAEPPPSLETYAELPDDHTANVFVRAYENGEFSYEGTTRRLEALGLEPRIHEPEGSDQTDQPDQTEQRGPDRLERLPRERADLPHAVTEPDIVSDYNPTVPPTAEERYFVRDQANPIPIFDGDPKREQVAQGQIGDCGVLSTLGAVAGHRPEAIRSAIRQNGPDQYAVTMHEVRPATPGNPVASPTGNTVTLHMNDTLPVDTSDPKRLPAGATATSCGWPSIMEKAVASQDQAWDQQQQSAWNGEWLHVLKPGVDQQRHKAGLLPSPTSAPTGYNRLDMGTTSEDRANLLAEVTGKESEVRPLPNEQRGEQALLAEFQSQLADGKPILVGSRAKIPGESHPFGRSVFEFSHAFEVTKVEDGKIHLRNPWGDWATPPPMDAKTFWEYFRHYGRGGGRFGDYSTLT